MATTKIYSTLSASGADNKKFTFSCWLKRDVLGGTNRILHSTNAGTTFQYLMFNTSDQLTTYNQYSGASGGELTTNRKFRDVGAWYHLVWVWDTANSTAGDRQQFWINGVRETSFAGESQPSLNQAGSVNSGNTTYIGGNDADTQYFSGLMSHINFTGDQVYSASTFGETDATDGMWKIKTSPSVNYSVNGYFLKMEDSSNLDLDSSGQSRSFTTAGTLTATKDNPSNNFATLLSLNKQTADGTIANGNTTFTYNADGTWRSNYATINASAGKYYFEMKAGNTDDNFIGILASEQMLGTNDTGYNQSKAYVMKSDGNLYNNNTSKSGGVAWTTNDVIGVAFDLTNGAIWFSKNNVWTNSATISEIAAGTTTNAAYTGITGDFYGAMGIGKEGAIQYFNFGNGYFGTTSVTSAGTNASGNGTFEYDVPTGFTALCTKGLNT